MSKLDELVSQLCSNGLEYKEIETLIKDKIIKLISPSIKIKRNDFTSNGRIPIVSQESEYISGYTNIVDKNIPKEEYICFGDHTEYIKYVDFQFVQGADGLKIMSIIDKDKLSPKYYYYAVCNFYKK